MTIMEQGCSSSFCFSIVSMYNESAFRFVVVILLGLILIELRSIISLLIDIARAFTELARGRE